MRVTLAVEDKATRDGRTIPSGGLAWDAALPIPVHTIGGWCVGVIGDVQREGCEITANLAMQPGSDCEHGTSPNIPAPGTRWGLAIEMLDVPADAPLDMLSGRLRGAALVHPDHAPWPDCVFTVEAK